MYTNPCQAYRRYLGAIPALKNTAGSLNFILVEKATKFSLHILGSIVKLEIMHDFSAALTEVVGAAGDKDRALESSH